MDDKDEEISFSNGSFPPDILIILWRGGQLIEMHLFESQLLNTFFPKCHLLDTKMCQLLDRQKYAVRVPYFVFEQLTKFLQQKKINLQFFSYREEKKTKLT